MTDPRVIRVHSLVAQLARTRDERIELLRAALAELTGPHPAQRWAEPVRDAVRRLADADERRGHPRRGRAGRIARQLRGLVSERHVRRILWDIERRMSDWATYAVGMGIDIHGYATYCGPRALDALLGLRDPLAAARLLVEAARDHGRDDWIEAETGGTMDGAMLAALRRLGYLAEPYDCETGEPTGEDPDDYYERTLAARPPSPDELAGVQEIIDSAPLPERPGLLRAYHYGIGRRMTVQRWAWTHPRDTWLLAARGRPPHYVALRFGRCIAGDDLALSRYGGSEVGAALRITRDGR